MYHWYKAFERDEKSAWLKSGPGTLSRNVVALNINTCVTFLMHDQTLTSWEFTRALQIAPGLVQTTLQDKFQINCVCNPNCQVKTVSKLTENCRIWGGGNVSCGLTGLTMLVALQRSFPLICSATLLPFLLALLYCLGCEGVCEMTIVFFFAMHTLINAGQRNLAHRQRNVPSFTSHWQFH